MASCREMVYFRQPMGTNAQRFTALVEVVHFPPIVSETFGDG